MSAFSWNTVNHQPDRGMVGVEPRQFFLTLASQHEMVSMNDRVVSGMPVVQGTRIPVTVILACLRDGMSMAEVCEDYGLTVEQVTAALSFVIDVLDRPFQQE